MDITFTVSEEEYQQLLQMLFNSNPLIRKIISQAQGQQQAAAAAKTQQKPAKPNGLEADKR